MDTNDLSKETYEAIITTAEKFNHDLALPFGCLASSCENDDEYLHESEQLIKEWLGDKYIEELMVDIFFENLPTKRDFKKALSDIQKNINKVRKIPIENRTFEF